MSHEGRDSFMLMRSLLAVGVVCVGAVVSARVMLDVPNRGPEHDGTGAKTWGAKTWGDTLALAPISIGNPAMASTLNTRIPGQAEPSLRDRHDLPDLGESPNLDSHSLDVVPAALTLTPYTKNLRVKRGATLAKTLDKAGIERSEVHAAVMVLKKVFDPRKLQAGQEMTLSLLPEPTGDGPGQLVSLTLEKDFANRIGVRRDDDGAFTAFKEKRVLERKPARSSGAITSSLYESAVTAGLPIPVLTDLIHTYSWDVDFQRDIQPGDSFQVMYEEIRNESGEVVHYGPVLHATLTLSGTALPVYRFETKDGRVGYFNDRGQSAKKALMRTPIDGARLSSRFGRRKHPILKYTKMHKGIDFAAPRGTPIYAAGDGTIDYAGRKGAYGKYVRIRHNSDYKTAYAHMTRFAKVARKGKRVRQGQIIGYVGSTGRSTGPHLHFEILRGGRQVNPLKVRMPSGRKLKGKELERFQAARAEVDERFAALADGPKLAQRD